MAAAALAMSAGEPPPAPEITPPRLSFIDGNASFWRPGAQDWAPARVNTPLAAGDALYSGERANLEIQIGPRAFVRATEKTPVGIVNIEPDFLQVKVASGQASLDVRSLADGRLIRPDHGSGIRTTAGPGSTTRLGDGRRFITGAGCWSAASGRGRPAPLS